MHLCGENGEKQMKDKREGGGDAEKGGQKREIECAFVCWGRLNLVREEGMEIGVCV